MYSNTGYKTNNKKSSVLHCYTQHKCNGNLTPRTIQRPTWTQQHISSPQILSKIRDCLPQVIKRQDCSRHLMTDSSLFLFKKKCPEPKKYSPKGNMIF